MKKTAVSTEESTGEDVPHIAALPTMTPEDHIARLIQENAALSDTLNETKAEQLRQAVTLEQTTHDLATAKASIVQREKEHGEAMQDKERDIAMVRGEMEEIHRLKAEAEKECEELTARWEEIERNPFYGTCLQVNRQLGTLHDEMIDGFLAVIDGVGSTGKGGSIAIKLSLKASEEHIGATIAVAEVKLTVPKEKPEKAYFFMDGGKVTEDDPKQKRLGLKGDKSRKPAPKAASAKVVTDDGIRMELAAEDEHIYAAAALIAAETPVTVGILQRRLKLGYTKAAIILAELERRGDLKVEVIN